MATDVNEDDDIAGDDDDKWDGVGAESLNLFKRLGLRVVVQVSTRVLLLVVAIVTNAEKWRDCHDDNGGNPIEYDIDNEVAFGVQNTVPFHWALDKNQPIESDGSEVEKTGTRTCVQEQTCDVTRSFRRPRPTVARG